jgi:predicted FMN-binding regulatory protein PaiB
MLKYQPEGKYQPIKSDMSVVNEVAIIKIVPNTMKGKYKIGQHLTKETRLELAKKILERNSPSSQDTIKIMGIIKTKEGLKILEEPVW